MGLYPRVLYILNKYIGSIKNDEACLIDHEVTTTVDQVIDFV